MTYSAHWKKAILATVFTVALLGAVSQAQAAELPLAAASPLTGVSFDDRPLLLPVQRNFQMAMLTAASELGRSCGKMEAYGWRMNQTEQGRVNQIFNNTVDRLRLMGYSIAPQTLTSVSKDITLFTADRANKHFMFLWSAGELGLVLNMCETSPPAPGTQALRAAKILSPSVQVFPIPLDDAGASRLGAGKAGLKPVGEFTPVGVWVGGYTCAQGYTGGTLTITRLRGEDFDGTFEFYSTEKNLSVPRGSYSIYGQYDKETRRILINPGQWVNQPKGFANTVMVGSFDAVHDGVSAYFQGVSGCTSFEAHRDEVASASLSGNKASKAVKASKKADKPAAKKSATKKSSVNKEKKKQPSVTSKLLPPLEAMDAPLTVDEKKDLGIVLSPETPATK